MITQVDLSQQCSSGSTRGTSQILTTPTSRQKIDTFFQIRNQCRFNFGYRSQCRIIHGKRVLHQRSDKRNCSPCICQITISHRPQEFSLSLHQVLLFFRHIDSIYIIQNRIGIRYHIIHIPPVVAEITIAGIIRHITQFSRVTGSCRITYIGSIIGNHNHISPIIQPRITRIRIHIRI